MNLDLKTTILASTAVAVLLNVGTLAVSYNQQARASFSPSWAEAASDKGGSAAVTTSAKPASAIEPAAIPASASSPAPPAGPAPAADPVAVAQAKLAAAGLKSNFAANYLAVQSKTGTPWQILAAVHHIETGQRGDSSIRSSAGAIGPMQFMPATFNAYAQDGDANGVKQITDFDDAALTAGRYLSANGAARGNYANALIHYNHSNTYVANVLNLAHRLGL